MVADVTTAMVIGFEILVFNTFSIFIHTRTMQASVLTHNSVKRLVVVAVTSLLISISVLGINEGLKYQYW